MDYQYRSICRGEHSIFERVRAAGVNPEDYIFFFNLRTYDRLNVTPAIKKQEKASGLKYQDVQRANAQEVLGEDIAGGKDARDKTTEFEAAREDKEDRQPVSADSVAKNAMLNTPKLSTEAWAGSAESEVDLWVQEELYIHSKLLIVDDKIAICGSANINDRSQLGYVSFSLHFQNTTDTIAARLRDRDYHGGYEDLAEHDGWQALRSGQPRCYSPSICVERAPWSPPAAGTVCR